MINILIGLIPFIFITFLGFLFGRFKILNLGHAKNLNLFLFYIAVPALIIKLVAQSEINQIDLKQIEIVSMDDGEPVVSKLNNINYRSIKVSISHENDYAIAFSILIK